ncbi:MAG: helix-turn-helix domain-containing protein [Planctomycetota bacterium]
MTEHPKEILTIEEACALLGISAKTFAKILREEDIPGRKIGREWKFSRQALIDWVGSANTRDFINTGKKKQGIRQVERIHRPLHEREQGNARPLRRHDAFSIEED